MGRSGNDRINRMRRSGFSLLLHGNRRDWGPRKLQRNNMKRILIPLACGLIAIGAFAAEETTTTTTTTRSRETISEYTPGSTFVVKETSGPVKYRYGKKVTYVTKGGKTLSADEVRTRIKVGHPCQRTIRDRRRGPRHLARRNRRGLTRADFRGKPSARYRVCGTGPVF